MSERVVIGRRVIISIALLVMAASRPCAADNPKPTGVAAAETRVVKLLGTSSEFAGNVSTTYIFVAPADGGPPAKMVLTDDVRRKISSLYAERGELITITVKSGSLGSDIVTSAVPFDGPKGLKSIKAFVFEGMGESKVGAQTYTVAKLSRLGQHREAIIPSRPVAGQKPAPDPVLIERLGKIKQGDVIEIEIAAGPAKGTFTLTDVDIYRDPQIGDFVKLETIKEGVKSFPAVALNLDDSPKVLALPAAASNSSAAAIGALARKLKPGYAVRFVARDDVARPTLREMRLDGEIQPTSDKNYQLVSTYVRVYFSGAWPDTYVYFYPGSNRPSDQLLERGVSRVISFKGDADRVKLNAAQTTQLRTAYDTRLNREDVTVKPAERTQWANAYNSWLNARDDAARTRSEQDMLWAAQELSMRWKRDIESKYTIMRSILTSEQLDEVLKLGKRATPSPAD
jgi:hypothetical protein